MKLKNTDKLLSQFLVHQTKFFYEEISCIACRGLPGYYGM